MASLLNASLCAVSTVLMTLLAFARYVPGVGSCVPPADRNCAFVYGGASGNITENAEPRKPTLSFVSRLIRSWALLPLLAAATIVLTSRCCAADRGKPLTAAGTPR